MPGLSRDLAGLFAKLTCLLLAQHSQLAGPLSPEDLTVHRHRSLAQPPGMLRQLETPLTQSALRLGDLGADFGTRPALQRRAHVPFDLGPRFIETLQDLPIDSRHGHLHERLSIQERTRGVDRASRLTFSFLHRASCRPFDLPHRGLERGLRVPFVSA
jgi:hypothetical protein